MPLEDLAYTLKPFLKKVFIVGLVVALGWLGYLGVIRGLRSLEPEHPHPTDPAETATIFFQALQQQEYQQCYRMLVASLKAATFVGQQSRESGYFPHFERIRHYLTQYAGDDFLAAMQISDGGRQATFANGVTLALQLEASRGSDKQNHYGIRGFVDFPIDAMKKMGAEKYYRGVNRVLESLDGLGDQSEIDDVSDVIRPRPGENKIETQKRWIDSFRRAPQLDTRHRILEWIIKRFAAEPATQSFLSRLARDDAQPAHLCNLAQRALDENSTRL